MKRFQTAVDPHPLPLRMVPISGNHVPCLHFILSGPCTTLHIFDRYKVPTWAWAVWAPFWYYIEMCRHSFHRFTPHIVNLRFFKKSYKKLHTKCSKQRRVGGTFFLIMLKNCRISSQWQPLHSLLNIYVPELNLNGYSSKNIPFNKSHY